MGTGVVGQGVDAASSAIQNIPFLKKVEQYGQTHFIDPAAEGIANYQVNPGAGTAFGAAGGVAQSAFNVLPYTALATNAATAGINTAAGASDAYVNDKNIPSGIEKSILGNNQDVAGGMGVTNPIEKAAINLGVQSLAFNPRGVVGGISNLRNLSGDAGSLAKNAGTLYDSAKMVAGLAHPGEAPNTPETPSASDIKTAVNQQLEPSPGIISVNPDKIQEAHSNVHDIIQKTTQPGTMTDIAKPSPGEPPVQTISQSPVQSGFDGISAPLQKAPVPAEAPPVPPVQAESPPTPPEPISQPQTAPAIPSAVEQAQEPAPVPVNIPHVSTPVEDAPVPPKGSEVVPPAPETAPTGRIDVSKFVGEGLNSGMNPASYYEKRMASLGMTPEEIQQVFDHVKANTPEGSVMGFKYRNGEDGKYNAEDIIDALHERNSSITKGHAYHGQTFGTAPETAPVTPEPTKIAQETPVEGQNTAPGDKPLAPNTVKQALENSGLSSEDQASIQAKMNKGNKVNLEQTQNMAKATTDALDDKGVATKYSSEQTLDTPQKIYEALEASKRLSGLDDPASEEARMNIYNSLAEASSKSGLNLRALQVLWQDMSPEMKVNATLRSVTKAAEKAFGDDKARINEFNTPENQKAVGDKLGSFVSKDTSLDAEMQSVRGKVANAKNDPSSVTKADTKALQSEYNDVAARKAANADDTIDYVKSIVPPNKTLGDTVSGYIRNSMLSGLSGRGRHFLGTAINSVDSSLSSSLSGLIGGAYNALKKSPGALRDSGPTLMDLGRGLMKVPGQVAADYRASSGIPDVEGVGKALKSQNSGSMANNAGNLEAYGKSAFSRGLGALVKAPGHIAEGIQSGTLRSLVRQEGQKAGLTGDALDRYTELGSINPDSSIQAKATEAAATVNNLNDNPVSKALTTLNEKVIAPVVGKPLATANNPFARFTGAKFWNDLTDRNVLANFGKMVYHAATGNTQGFVDQLSKTVVHGGEAAALSYLAAQAGLLTTTDANGKSYDGLYLHVGNAYVPVSSLGAVGVNMLLGYSAYTAYKNSQDGQDAATNMVNTGNTFAKSFSGAEGTSNITGSGDSLIKAITDAGTTPAKGAADLASMATGAAIPSIAGDINSIENNSPLNPTGEAADTSVTDPNSKSGKAKDYLSSAVAAFENKFPNLGVNPGFNSQQLPRVPGEASQSFVDRVTQGNHTSPQQEAAAASDAATVSSSYKHFQDMGVFTPDIRKILDPASQKIYDSMSKGGTVSPKEVTALTDSIAKGASTKGDSRFLSDGNYAANLTALRIASDKADANPMTTQKTLNDFTAQIARGVVYLNNKVPYSLIKQYDTTAVSDWRNMGNPKSSAYDPTTYQALWNLDSELAKGGGSLDPNDPSGNKYSLKAAGAGSGRRGGAQPTNAIHSLLTLKGPNLSKITGKTSAPVAMPNIVRTAPGSLIKMRSISVGRAKA
jgi:hypothetical protein